MIIGKYVHCYSKDYNYNNSLQIPKNKSPLVVRNAGESHKLISPSNYVLLIVDHVWNCTQKY